MLFHETSHGRIMMHGPLGVQPVLVCAASVANDWQAGGAGFAWRTDLLEEAAAAALRGLPRLAGLRVAMAWGRVCLGGVPI